MNYASANEPENHEPMTMLDPQGMEASVSNYMQSDEFKRKAAERTSAPASVEVARLEELAPELRKVVLELYSNPKTASMTIGQYLQLSGIVETTGGDEWTVIFTERGAALVRDYQRRQEAKVSSNMAAIEIEKLVRDEAQDELDRWDMHEFSNARQQQPAPINGSAVSDVPTDHGFRAGDVCPCCGSTLSRSAYNRVICLKTGCHFDAEYESQKRALEAENARLQGELDAARKALRPFANMWDEYIEAQDQELDPDDLSFRDWWEKQVDIDYIYVHYEAAFEASK